MTSAERHLVQATVRAQKQGRAVGVYAICSANRFVLEAAMKQAAADGASVIIESTSNQVDQFGGYTGMTPVDFVGFVAGIAQDLAFPRERIILGGDHLGPNAWQGRDAETAMGHARDLIRAYIRAGYTKIHLDASMRCTDDPESLDDEIAAGRTADLCAASEAAYADLPGKSPPPVYVVGTEVPVPGGAQEAEESLSVTAVEDAERTIVLTREAFCARGLQAAWQRTAAVVVQPGVEFGDADIFDYDRKKARALSTHIERDDHLIYEAHSTDYQTPRALKEMVEDHFAILKVGPWLTFAFREAVFALAQIETEWLSSRRGIERSRLRESLDRVMVDDPTHWQKYYRGNETDRRHARKYSYSDRSRYYWPRPELQTALQRLLANLAEHPPPLTLISQYLPVQYTAVREGRISRQPVDLIHDKIMEVTASYAAACNAERNLP